MIVGMGKENDKTRPTMLNCIVVRALNVQRESQGILDIGTELPVISCNVDAVAGPIRKQDIAMLLSVMSATTTEISSPTSDLNYGLRARR